MPKSSITPLNGNVVRPILGPKPAPWEPPLPDLHLLTLKTLVRHRIITAREEDVDRALANPEEARGPIEGGAYVVPPFCVWGLPRSNQAKGMKGDKGPMEAPRLWFLGAPLMGVKAAGLSQDFSESVAKADDPRWTHQAMRYIHARGGYVYGGQWSTVRWSQGKGVDTSDFQRVAEYAMDQLAVQDPDILRAFLTGEAPAKVLIRSIREAQRLITGIWKSTKEASSEELQEHRENKFFVLDQLAHPEFTILTTAHRGQAVEETLASFRIFGATTRVSGSRGAQGWELLLTPVAVALSVGMATRLGRIVSEGRYAFDPQGVAHLLGWLNDLKESERRLARHLLLSQGDRDGYAYLKEPYYAAGVLGHRLSDDRRTRDRIGTSIMEAAQSVLEALGDLQALPGAEAYLRRALETMGVGTVAKPAPTQAPSLGLDLEEEAPAPSIETVPEARTTVPNARITPLEPQGPSQMHDATVPNARTGLYQMRDTTVPNARTEPYQMRASTVPNARTISEDIPYSSGISSTTISSNVINNSFPKANHQSIGTQPHQEGDIARADDRLTDGLRKNISLMEEEKRNVYSSVKEKTFSGEDEIEGGDPYLDSVLLPPPSGNRMGRPENRLKNWPRPLKEAVADLLFPAQMSILETDCRWNPEGAWAIFQGIHVDGAGLSSKGGVLYNALRNPRKGRVWGSKAGSRLREAGWCEEPEDGTPEASQERRLAGGRLAPYQRMPLDEVGQIRRGEILQKVAEKRRIEAEDARRAREEQAKRDVSAPQVGEHWDLWRRILDQMAELVPERSYQDWIVPCVPVAFDGHALVLRCPTPSTRIWIEQQLADEFHDALEAAGLAHLRVTLYCPN